MAGAEVRSDLWIYEYMSPDDIYAHGVRQVLAHRRTAYQEMYIVDSGLFGKALVLDGKWQSCTGDEFLYHEPLVHVPCLQHGGPRRVLILGGGEGATLREVLKWETVERATMVDLDGEVVEACKKHLPEMHQGAFDDPRAELVIGDAIECLKNSRGAWDVILSDLTDPIEHGPSFRLFTKEYFETCRQALRDGGVFVVQAGPVSPPELDMHVRLNSTVRAVFESSAPYASAVPTYAAPWGFILGRDGTIETRPEPEAIDTVLEQRVGGGLRMLDGAAMLGLMQVPKHVREAIAAETELYTLEDPPRLFGTGIGSDEAEEDSSSGS